VGEVMREMTLSSVVLPGAVASEQAEDFTVAQIERDIAQGPEEFRFFRWILAMAAQTPGKIVPENLSAEHAQPIGLAEVFDAQDEGSLRTRKLEWARPNAPAPACPGRRRLGGTRKGWQRVGNLKSEI
jgi:hypothetical protein